MPLVLSVPPPPAFCRRLARRVRARLLAGLVLLASAFAVFADSDASPRDYSAPTADGRHILVVLAPDDAFPERNEELRRKYARSGLYRAGERGALVWELPSYSPWIRVANDGRFAVMWAQWPSSSPRDATEYDRPVIRFLDRGKVIREYATRQLVKDPTRLPHSVSHFRWAYRTDYDPITARFKVVTWDGSTYILGPRGEIVSREWSVRPMLDRWIQRHSLHVVAGAIVVAFILWRVARKSGRRLTSR